MIDPAQRPPGTVDIEDSVSEKQQSCFTETKLSAYKTSSRQLVINRLIMKLKVMTIVSRDAVL